MNHKQKSKGKQKAVYTPEYRAQAVKLAVVHIPAHDGHLSALMAVRIPGAWRSAFRRHGGQFVAPTGMLTAMSGIGL